MDYPHRDIRFTTTEDGVSIAYWEIGEGKPLMIIHNFSLSHAELEWTVPTIASFYTALAERYRVIRFDPRGFGLSGEPPGGWGAMTESGAQQGMSIREMGLDISAVSAALDLDRFALMGNSIQGPVAIAYAAEHSEVSELILFEAMAKVASSWLDPILHAEMAVRKLEDDGSGPIFTFWERLSPPDEVDQLVRLVRDSNLKDRDYSVKAQMEWDAESLLGEVSIPTLVLSSRTSVADILPDARRLAAGITGSQLRVVDGQGSYYSDRTQALEAIDALLKPERPMTMSAPPGFRTVVFTDIVGSTEYIRHVGDEAGREAVRDLEQKVAALATDHGGRVVKNLGDGSLVSFGSNSSAIDFALEVQDKCSDGPLKLRVGMAAGEPIQEDGDIHGTVVAHASRIGDLGDAGEVIVSDSVRQLAAGKGFAFVPRGEVTLKGFDEPERIWQVTAK